MNQGIPGNQHARMQKLFRRPAGRLSVGNNVRLVIGITPIVSARTAAGTLKKSPFECRGSGSAQLVVSAVPMPPGFFLRLDCGGEPFLLVSMVVVGATRVPYGRC